MSNLDDKLKEILQPWLNEIVSEYGTGINDDKKRPFNDYANAIPQIKQAFADEGYAQTLKFNGRTIVANGKDPLGYVVYFSDEEALKATPENVSAPFSVMLTGQEWYERFLSELPIVEFIVQIRKVESIEDAFKQLCSEARLAAKRAAGLAKGDEQDS